MSFSLRQNLNFGKIFLGIPAPIYVQFAITKSCLMHCRMCNVTRSRQDETELDIGQIGALAEVIGRMGVGLIVLSGGEPLLRADLAEAVRAFSRRGITVRLQSNGILMRQDVLQELYDAGLNGITVSLHSLSEQKTAHLTGIADALPRILDGLCAAGGIFGKRGRILGINTVVSALNLTEIPRLVEFVTRIGFSLSLIPLHGASGDGHIVRKGDRELMFLPRHHKTIDAVFDRVIAMKHAGFNIYNSDKFLRESAEFLKTGGVRWQCRSPRLYFSISPSGRFLPCV
ncbi:MAG: radical SAM protein, partial [Chitinivibrionales bacterium]|nr:radical SAM protein [Chitinivibrionales bacterium]